LSSSKISDVVEEYLEIIYRLQEQRGVAKTSDLVRILTVAPGTVTNTIERLEKNLLIVHEPYKGVQLTEKGFKIAMNVIRKHRLLECLLANFLGIEWYEAHDAACQLEHWISEEIAKKIEAALGYPKTCPHGNPIPTEYGEIFEEKTQSLIELNIGDGGIIIKITDEGRSLLQYFSRLGIKPKKRIDVIDKAPFNGPITVKVDGRSHALSRDVASLVRVSKL
jgi:DtxR family Mn-dependent transcriptional regulator